MSTGLKVLLGCGAGCLVMIMVFVIMGVFVWRTAMKRFGEITGPFVEQGYKQVVSNSPLVITTDPKEKTLYLCKHIILRADFTEDVAIIGPRAEIYGQMNGKVTFLGSSLFIANTAELTKGLSVETDILTLDGKVDGPIDGHYKVLNDHRAEATQRMSASRPASAPSPGGSR